MKKYIKLFEEYLKESDLLGDMGLGGEEGGDAKPKEDPLEKQKKEAEAKEKKAKEQHEREMNDAVKEIKEMLKDYPEVKEKIFDNVEKAIRESDRALIRVAINDIIFLQQDMQNSSDTDGMAILTKIKEKLGELDKTYTANKYA